MPRSGKVEKRQIAADSIYQNLIVAKLINKLMKDGKKAWAKKIVYEAFKDIESKGQNPLTVLESALENVTPRMEVRPRRVGGASYMVPMEVRGARRVALAISWIVDAARAKTPQTLEKKANNKPLMITKLATELVDAAKGEGKAVAKREEMHRMAEANKAFAHFRW